MISRIPLLQNVKVAAPCHESWEGMTSVDGDRVHFCVNCQLNVYNLSAMTQAEAEGLLRKHEGHLCVRYYQRHDGTILTKNCPVGAHAAHLLLIRQSKAAAALFIVGAYTLLSMSMMGKRTPPDNHPTMGSPMMPVVEEVKELPDNRPTMGAVAIIPPKVESVKPILGKVVKAQ